MRENDFKLREWRFRLEVRSTFFTQKVMWPWHKLLTEDVGFPLSLEVSEAGLDGLWAA